MVPVTPEEMEQYPGVDLPSERVPSVALVYPCCNRAVGEFHSWDCPNYGI